MNEDEVKKLVAAKLNAEPMEIPWQAKARMWIGEFLHPLIHTRVHRMTITAESIVIDDGYACRFCGRPM